MPAMHYRLRWPDGSETLCYSPSLIIRERFRAGESHPIAPFVQRLREATGIAEERVMAKYGFVCSRASDQLSEVVSTAQRFETWPEARIEIVSFEDIAT